jgi:hypothetical protein
VVRPLLTVGISLAVLGGIVWAVVAELETQPTARDEPPAIVLRAPEGFDVKQLGEASLPAVAAELRADPNGRVGVEFFDDGDHIVLLADREDQRVVEMRASRSGTIVERVWPEEVDRRLDWAIEHGSLDAPGLPPATGKNLYH